MQSKAATVAEYLASLPEDRRAEISAVREVVRKNLDKDYEEGMQYGMIGYYVPHRVYPQGYHCDPRQPLPFAGLASQKNHMALYLMCVYLHGDQESSFRQAWAKTGKKLDMGKSCVRFKKVDDLALDVIGATIRGVPAKKYIGYVESVLATRYGPAKTSAKAAKKASPAAAKKKAVKKSATPRASARKTVKKKTAR